MATAELEIINKLGLHARAASKLASVCATFASKIVFSKGAQTAEGKSIMSLMLLAAGKGVWLTVECVGADEQQAIESIVALFEDKFGEAE